MKTCRLAATALVACAFGAQSQDLDRDAKALNLIADFADRICSSPPLEGEASNLELSASGKAAVSKFVRQLADLRIDASVKYDAPAYKGVLQKDLTGLLRGSENCRMKVYDDLKEKLLPSVKPEK